VRGHALSVDTRSVWTDAVALAALWETVSTARASCAESLVATNTSRSPCSSSDSLANAAHASDEAQSLTLFRQACS